MAGATRCGRRVSCARPQSLYRGTTFLRTGADAHSSHPTGSVPQDETTLAQNAGPGVLRCGRVLGSGRWLSRAAICALDDNFNAPIVGPPLSSPVARDWLGFAETFRLASLRRNAALDQIVSHRLCPALGASLVESRRPARVRVPFHYELTIGIPARVRHLV